MDKVQPGVVQWNRVNLAPKNKFKRTENCNYAVVLGKSMRFSLVNVGGLDIVDGNKKLILGTAAFVFCYPGTTRFFLRLLSPVNASHCVAADAPVHRKDAAAAGSVPGR
jgi:hypothetical protein